MKYLVKIAYIFFSIFLLYYLTIPAGEFPAQLDKTYQSFEPADIETSLRRGYYTDFDRNGVMEFYTNQYRQGIFNNTFFTVNLNYPPEEAQTIIRDQTKSTFLEEIVHPLRESLFINGFEPKDDKDRILVRGKEWRMKIIVRSVQSSPFARLIVGIGLIVFIPFLFQSWKIAFDDLIKATKK